MSLRNSVQTSTLPAMTMRAGSAWDDIARRLSDAEKGRDGGATVDLQPGGAIVVRGPGEVATTLSSLPNERMAALNRGPSPGDVEELRRLDPGNVEEWVPVSMTSLEGWKFRLRPDIDNALDYVFLAFRSPSDGNAWRISVLQPLMDDAFGHGPHMIRRPVGNVNIPVICGPGGAPAMTLAEVRTHAAKWMVYTARKHRGENPRFSL